MQARNYNTQATPAPSLHIAAPPLPDTDVIAIQDMLGTDYVVYRNRRTARYPYDYQAETKLTKRRALADLRAAGIADLNYEIQYETETQWTAYVQFNAPQPAPEPVPVARQIPACVGIAEPGTPVAIKGTPDYESHTRHLKAQMYALTVTQAWMEAQRFKQQNSRFNVWRHIQPTHSAWVRLPDFQRVEAIKAKQLRDDTWWYAVDISTDPARTMLKWYREDALTLVQPTDADKARDAERRKSRAPKPQTPHEVVSAHIGQRIHIPNGFDAGNGQKARGCDYTIIAMQNAHTKPKTALVKFPDGSTEERSIGVIYGEITHHARQEAA
jgi:hypothetical protein